MPVARERHVPVLALVLSAGCGGWGGSIEERGGVVRVENPARPLWEESGPGLLELDSEQSFGSAAGPAETILGFVLGVAVDDAGRVYVLDARPPRIVAFAPDGSPLWSSGEAGEGPGELDRATSLAWDGADGLLVSNRAGTHIERWDLAGNYVEAFSLARLELRFARLAGVVDPDRAVVFDSLGGLVGARIGIVELSRPPTLAASFVHDALPELEPDGNLGVPADVKAGLGAGLGPARPTGLSILAGSLGEYSISGYDAGGRLRKTVTRPEPRLVRPGYAALDGRDTVRHFGAVDAPVVLGSGHWLTLATWARDVDDPDRLAGRMLRGEEIELEWGSALDLFDARGRWLLSREHTGTAVPEIGEPRLVGPDGDLYTVVQDPFPQVRRYRVRVHPQELDTEGEPS